MPDTPYPPGGLTDPGAGEGVEGTENPGNRLSRRAFPGHRIFRCFIGPALLVALVVAAYSSIFQADFVVWDDDDHIYENPHITAADGYGRAWKDWRDTAFYPLTFTSFFIEWRLADGEPWLFHVDNVALHTANALAVGLLGRALALGPGVAWAAAGLWALHPVQVASVAWITERKNVLYGLFFLAALLAYSRALDGSAAQARRLWLLSLLFALASLMSKAMAVTLPVTVVLFHWARGRAFDWRSVGRLSSYFALALAVGLLHVWREEVTAPLALGTRILIAARAVWFYVFTFLWPSDLVAMYPRWSTHSALSWGLPALGALAVVLGVLGWQFRRLPRAAGFAVGHFAVNVSLVVGIIWFPYMRHSFVADHLVYLASIGLALLAAMAGRAVFEWLRVPGSLQVAVVAALWLVLAGLSKEQATQWRDTEALWTRTLEVNPLSTTAHNNLGVKLIEAERLEEARAHFEESLRIDPDDAKAMLNLGVLAAGRGEWAEAIAFYKKALRYNIENPFIWNNLGVAAAEQGDGERAVAFYRHAMKLDPDDATTYTNLGAALGKQGDWAAAIEHHETALRLNPRFMKAHYNLAVALSEEGRNREAATHFEAANDIEPGDVAILSRLASALSEDGDLQGARARLEEALEAQPGEASVHYEVGSALAELGETDRAIAHLERALEAGPQEARGPIHTIIGALLDEAGEGRRAIDHYRKAAELSADDPDVLYNLGAALSAEGRHGEAAAEYRRVLARDPDHLEATNNLGAALFAQGEVKEAVRYFERAHDLDPDDADARRNLAMALHETGRTPEAINMLEETLARGGEQPELLNLMAWIKATSPVAAWRDGARAVRLAEEACTSTDHGNVEYLDTLAAAYAEAGRFADAVRVVRQALDLADGESEMATVLRRRLSLYEDGRPYRDQ